MTMRKSDTGDNQYDPNDSGTDTTAHQLANAFVIAGTGSEWISAPPEHTVDIAEVQ